jgi:hypothetical protein
MTKWLIPLIVDFSPPFTVSSPYFQKVGGLTTHITTAFFLPKFDQL